MITLGFATAEKTVRRERRPVAANATDDARLVIYGYSQRWRVEECHRTIGASISVYIGSEQRWPAAFGQGVMSGVA